MTPELLARKKAETLTDLTYEGRWRSLQRAGSVAMTENNREWLPTLAAMSLLTDAPGWAERAEVLLAPIVNSGITLITPDRGKPVGQEVLQVALAYDWIGDRLTPGMRDRLKATLETWGQWVFPETNPARAGALGIDAPWSNYFFEFLRASWLAGLALQGDSPVGDTLIALSRGKWLIRAFPWLKEHCAGGYHVEGSNYGLGCLVSILEMLLANKTATGEEIPGWLDDALDVLFHTTTPGMGGKAPFSDQASDYHAVQSDTDRLAALLMASLAGGCEENCKYWLDNIKRNRCLRGPSLWFEYMYYPSTATPVNYLAEPRASPLFYYAEGAGYVSRRSGLEKDSTQVQVVCGPKFSDHQDDAGTVVICRGNDWLLGHAKIWSASGLQKSAEFVNVITVDGRGQNNQADKTARITSVANNPGSLCVTMDLSRAYDYDIGAGKMIRPLKSYQRTVVYLPAGVVIIHDRVEKNNPNSVIRSYLNTHRVLVPVNQYLGLVEGTSALYVSQAQPLTPPLLKSLPLGSGSVVSSYQAEWTPPAGQVVDTFLMVYQAGANGFTPLPVAQTTFGVEVGDDEAQFLIDGSVNFLDHRVSPRDKALLDLEVAATNWRLAHSDQTEAMVPAVIAAARALVSITG